ncbi:transposase [Clostridium sp. DSM 8431]|uniref:transposase n=1 Tax=Clostridium sp. DSM 8431 TaxID=1761781 RepID=UPI001FA8C4AF|nr:transposase [Clostridium sp. DSM 8431]
MEKFMKFTMFEKETKNKKYCDNPYRAINFSRDDEGNLICPNGKKFIFKYEKKVRKNKYGRTEEFYECEDCEGCPHRSECCKRTTRNRTVSLNRELTSMHKEVINNLESIHGVLLCMNRSIQSEGTFGIIKWNRSYKRLFRRGLDNVILELTLISCGYNLYKYNNKLNRKTLVA